MAAIQSKACVTRYGYGEACRRIEIARGGPPRARPRRAVRGRRILERVKAHADDLVLCLISGGASRCWHCPRPPDARDKQAVNRTLLKSGANIVEMNTVRKTSLPSKVGARGRRSAGVRAELADLDVPNDDPGVIGSGPTVPTARLRRRAGVLAKYRIDPPRPCARISRRRGGRRRGDTEAG